MSKPNSSDLSHSFTDLMTSLAVIFILLLVSTLNNYHSDSEDAISDLRNEVREELEKLKLKLEPDPHDRYTHLIKLDENMVKFERNSSTLKPEGKLFVDKVFAVLTPKLCDQDLSKKLESVIIEGHTDSSGNEIISGKLWNVRLSQDRAFAVMNEAFTSIESAESRNVDCLRRLVSVAGRGSNRPLDNNTASRRVEVKIRVKPGSESRS